MAQLQQGYMFDSRYQLLRKLGEGGYSQVWLVKDTVGDIELVLKIFLPDSQLDEQVEDLFRKEFKLVYNLNHPNLLRYSYFGVCLHYPYLLMPFFDKGSAESMIGRCSEAAAWRYLRDVSAGLSCLHSQYPSIVHQDIKPANVLLGDDGNFIITDFGISASTHGLFTGGRDCSVQGTRPYMPPEKFQADPLISVEGDIWSLGASLYELLTGRLPFGSEGGANQLNGSVLPQRPANVSYDLWEVISNCLSLVPRHRPTARMLEDLSDNKLNATSYVSPLVQNPYSSSGDYTHRTPSFDRSSQGNLGSNHFSETPRLGKERNFLPWLVVAASVILVSVVVVLAIIQFSSSGKSQQKIDPVVVEIEQPSFQKETKNDSKKPHLMDFSNRTNEKPDNRTNGTSESVTGVEGTNFNQQSGNEEITKDYLLQ